MAVFWRNISRIILILSSRMNTNPSLKVRLTTLSLWQNKNRQGYSIMLDKDTVLYQTRIQYYQAKIQYHNRQGYSIISDKDTVLYQTRIQYYVEQGYSIISDKATVDKDTVLYQNSIQYVCFTTEHLRI